MSHRNDKLNLCKKESSYFTKRKIVWQVLLSSALYFRFPSILRFNYDQQIVTEIVGKCVTKVISYFCLCQLKSVSRNTRKYLCSQQKQKRLYRYMKKKDKQKNKTSNSSISLVSEDMLRISSSWKPKNVRHKGGISSWRKRLRKSQMSTDIGNEIYVQGATQLEHGGQYLFVAEECQSLMLLGLIWYALNVRVLVHQTTIRSRPRRTHT